MGKSNRVFYSNFFLIVFVCSILHSSIVISEWRKYLEKHTINFTFLQHTYKNCNSFQIFWKKRKEIQQGSEYQTNLVFKWRSQVLLANVKFSSHDLNIWQIGPAIECPNGHRCLVNGLFWHLRSYFEQQNLYPCVWYQKNIWILDTKLYNFQIRLGSRHLVFILVKLLAYLCWIKVQAVLHLTLFDYWRLNKI